MDDTFQGRDRRDAPRPLCELRARLQDDARRNRGASLRERLRMETESALDWDLATAGRKENSPDQFKAGGEFAEGNEHRIFLDGEGKRALKLTRPPNYGARGSLLEYLDNLVLNNAEFGDDLRLEGIFATEDGPQLVVSQPWIQGRPATLEEIADFFEHRGYLPSGVHAWWSETTGTRIMDARPANIFIDSATGLMIPIDVHITTSASRLEEAWQEQRTRENRIP